MKLDNEEQRQLLMQLLDMATFPGAARRQVYELGEAIAKAAVETDEISGPITASK